MDIERTELANQEFNAHKPNKYEFYRGMYQAILGEEPHVTDPIAREDTVFYRLGELVEENAITSDEAFDCFNQYILSVRPDVKVIHLGQVISKQARFYE